MAALVKKRVLGFSPYGYVATHPFAPVFTGGFKNCRDYGFDGIDAFILNGGTDIWPGYYNEQHHKWNDADPQPSERDSFEWKAILYCRNHQIPIIGVCRGAQLLCAAAGGSLIQHVEGHGHDHTIITKDGEIMLSTSIHHQMMNPWSIDHELLAWCDGPLSITYQNGEGNEVREMQDHEEPEIVYFPALKGLGIQGHPEYNHATNLFKNLCCSLVEEKLLK